MKYSLLTEEGNPAAASPEIREGSLVLTVLNEELSLPSFLHSIAEQRVLPNEIVVVDGGSTDDTVEQLRSWAPPAGCTLIVLEQPGANISEGRNLAVAHASSDRILVTDAGTILDSEWSALMLAAFDEGSSPDVIGGFFRPTGRTLVERTIAFAITPNVMEIDGSKFLPSSRSLGFTRQAWSNAGGYPEWLDYCEDLLFDLRMKQLDLRFTFVADAVVTWSARSNIASFMKQYFRYARGDGKANLWAKRHAARYAAYTAGLSLLALSFAQPLALVLLVGAAGAYLAKFWRRLWRGREGFGYGLFAGLALAPVVVVAGDLAKMAGYPAGISWRRRRFI